MKVGILQFCPARGEPAESRIKADQLLAEYSAARELDLLVLPEMCFTGYVFDSKEEIRPIVETAEEGASVEWARKTAKRFDCMVQLGFPRVAHEQKYHNSILLTTSRGAETMEIYDKHFLFETDENWAEEGDGFHAFDTTELGRVGVGICMDINPRRFEAPFDAFEFAQFMVNQQVDFIFLSNAWLLNKEYGHQEKPLTSPCKETINYWALRLSPLIEASASNGRRTTVIISNRTGSEGDKTFCGSSCVLVIHNGKILLVDCLGYGEEKLLVVDLAPVFQMLDNKSKT